MTAKQREIIEAVAHASGVSYDKLMGRGQTSSVCRARRACFILLRSRLGMSYIEIGELFWRDQGGVREAVKTAAEPTAEIVREALAALDPKAVLP